MKAKASAAILLALCMILCSCAENDGENYFTESVTVSLTETAASSAAETTAPDKKLLGDYTVTTPEETEPSEPAKYKTFSLYDLWEKSDGEYVQYCYPLDKERVCFVYGAAGEDGTYRTQSFRVLDIPTGEKLWEKDFRSDQYSDFNSLQTKTDDALFKVIYDVYKQNGDGTPDYNSAPDCSVTFVYSDFTDSTTSPEETELSDIAFVTGARKAAQSDVNITDENGNILAAGHRDTETSYGWYSRTPYYRFPAGNDRFVYKTSGFERWYNMGVYDFETGTATDIPDTEDLYPVGYHDGKIFSFIGGWDSWGGANEFYTTDTETFETVRHELPLPEAENNMFYSFDMPESGEYIISVRKGDLYSEEPVRVFVIDPDSFEVTAEYALDGLPYYASPSVVYADSSVFMLWERDSGTLMTFYP